MNDNPNGTPNPLNPAPGAGEDMAAGTGPLDFVETANVSEEVEEPKTADTPEAETPEISEEKKEVEITEEPEPTQDSEPIKPASFTEAVNKIEVTDAPEDTDLAEETKLVEEIEPVEDSQPIHVNHSVADPMMRPVSHSNFDTLSMDETTIDDGAIDEVIMSETIVNEEPSPLTATPINNEPDLVPKDSIVEPVGGSSRKKILTIGAIILLIIALVCGAAAAAIYMLSNNNSSDRVNKAIEKLINGETSSIVAVQGTINAVPSTDDVEANPYDIDFNGSFDTKSGLNTVSAKINTEIAGGNKISIGVDELRNKSGDVFLKVRGLESLLGGTKTTNSESVENLNKCVDSTDGTKCLDTAGDVTATDLVSAYSGLVDAINNQWILVSEDFSDSMEGLGIFDNSSTCLINALGTLPQYSKDIAKKYEANQFITYSTDKLEISKKKNALYRLGFDDQKLTEFVNSLSNNGFMNELNACVGNTATNTDVMEETISEIFGDMPTVYVEIDDDNNFTRVYFKATTSLSVYDNGGTGTCQCIMDPCDCPGGFYETPITVTADLNLTYPSKLDITEPEDYVDMSNLVNKLMTNILHSASN